MKRVAVLCVSLLSACSGASTTPPTGRVDAGHTDSGGVRLDSGIGEDVGVDAGPRPDAAVPAGYQGLVLNELAAAGDPADWFELHNGSSAMIDLSGVTFTDDPAASPAKAVFADGTTIAPGGYLLRMVDDTDPGFKLGSDEQLAILAPDGVLIDAVDWAEGESPVGGSYGRIPNGTGAWRTLATPTPGAPNVDEAAPVCGDGVIDGAEVCDGAALAGATCTSRGFTGGTLACAAGCLSFDEAGCTVAEGAVVLNEVTSSGDDRIELFNPTVTSIDLTGWWIHDRDYDPNDAATVGQRFDLAAGTSVAGGGYLVLVKGTDHSFGVGGADALTLRDASGLVVDTTEWPEGAALVSWCRMPNGTGVFGTCGVATFGAENDSAPGPVCGDGMITGAERCDGAALGGATCQSEGFDQGTLACAADCASLDTSGCSDLPPPPPARVVVNEVTSTGDDLIELFNSGGQAADLSGWMIVDDGWTAGAMDAADHQYVFPAGTSLDAGAYRVSTKGVEHAFGLGGSDGVRLFDASGALVDATGTWPSGQADPSWCRAPNGTGTFVTCAAPTFGGENP